MKFEDYEREHYARYRDFANAVRFILDHAITQADDVARPQSIQARAKTPASLRKRLEEAGNLDADVELVRRDLAGVRLIFYTNTDVDRFLNSRLVFANFQVDHESTKIHHPSKENGETRYSAIHYTVTLKEHRAVLPEYTVFRGMRCEIQVQTILVHAWSETSHDIIYKTEPREGYGNKSLETIRKRFERIMDKYLLPAGYEFQRVQHDYERLKLGKELFDQNLLESIARAVDNNERHAQITSLKDDVLPNYDDIPAVFSEIADTLVAAAEAAQETAASPIETPFGEYPGKTSGDVSHLVAEVLDTYRYCDIEKSYSALESLFILQKDEEARKRILEAVEHLAQYNIGVWEQVGPMVQARIAALIDARPQTPSGARPVLIAVWGEILSPEMTGTEWGPESVSLQTGEVPLAAVERLRDAALEGLFKLFRSSTEDDERRVIFWALTKATNVSGHTAPEGGFLRRTLRDHARIARFLAEEAEGITYELRETLEDASLRAYHDARDLAESATDPNRCRAEAAELAAVLLELRDRLNADETYVRYKTLVGYECVFHPQWEDREFGYEKVDAYRKAQVERYVQEISADNPDEWLRFAERCASTKSNDLATFPIFGRFLFRLAEEKPAIADFFLRTADGPLVSFLPFFLNGLLRSDVDLYRKQRDRFIETGQHLFLIARHWRIAKPDDPNAAVWLLNRSVECGDRVAVMECILLVMEEAPSHAVPAEDDFFRPGMSYLTRERDARWVQNAWFGGKQPPFFEGLKDVDARLILENLLFSSAISFQVERVLSLVALQHLALVWEYFGERIQRAIGNHGQERYDIAPHRFQLLSAVLSRDIGLAIRSARQWYRQEPRLFRFRGGRVLTNAFPDISPPLSDALVELIQAGDGDDADFVLEIMQSYHGEVGTHDVLKAAIEKFPDDERRMSRVARCIDATGVVHGEFGFVEAYREKKASIQPWLDDPRPEVRAFAERHLKGLDLEIAQEQRRADSQRVLRRLEFDEDDQDPQE